ncbi:MAG: metal ABC transporter permease [Planctomyces sp.]|nr:metal ABC transporter permease [Planctomyces sp.]
MDWYSKWDASLDGWIVVAGILCAVAAALPGNFLVLRRMSMLGDAVSHAILPGLAIAFFISNSRSSIPMLVGAVIAGLLTALFTEWIRGFGDVDEGASMGVVFTTLFAIGLILIVQAADHVDLDPSCVLSGSIETIPEDLVSIGQFRIPRVVLMLSGVLMVNVVAVSVFYKEFQVSAFDAALGTTQGIPAWIMHYLLMVLVAVTAVASFESVGNILVVAMFVVPPSTARLLTDRLGRMILLSCVIAAVGAALGHISAIAVPPWLGFDRSVSTSGMMALTTGLLFVTALLFAPHQGVVPQFVRRQLLSLRILSEDLIALMYRMEERSGNLAPSTDDLRTVLLSGRYVTQLLMRHHRMSGTVVRQTGSGRFQLTDKGRRQAAELVRSHRLWEQYLVSEAGVSTERIHQQAEKLEHFTGRDLRDRLDQQTATPTLDPHGRPIPAENNPS